MKKARKVEKARQTADYERFLTRITDEIFEAAAFEGLTWIGLANKAELAVTTVYNLGNRVTRFPQLRTFFRLAKAVGMNVRLLRKEVMSHGEKGEVRESIHA